MSKLGLAAHIPATDMVNVVSSSFSTSDFVQ